MFYVMSYLSLVHQKMAGPTAVSLEGLHNWSDDKGAGWKTMRKAVPGAGGFIDMFFFGRDNASQASDFG